MADQSPVRESIATSEGPPAKLDLDVPPAWKRPKISKCDVKPDARVGINIHLEVVNFDFDVASLGEPGATAQGREQAFGFIHLYINGRKKNRIYGPDFYLKEDELTESVNRLEFVLATPGYGRWLDAGKPVSTQIELSRPRRSNTIPRREPKGAGHRNKER